MSFEQMQNEVNNCRRCRLCDSRTNTVFGEGNPETELMFIGEGPGRDEDEQGRPFVGKSGQLLTKMINAMGYERKDVYIANIVKCRPPNNRNPLPDEAEMCLPFLLRQIEIIKPKVIILLGAVPLKYLLNKTGITKLHGEWFDFSGIKTIASFHPAFLLRDPRQKKHAWADLQKAMKVLGKPVKPVSGN
jgi:DNA polymerase